MQKKTQSPVCISPFRISNPLNTSLTDGIPAVTENFNTRFVTFNANGVISRAGPPFASQIGAIAGQPNSAAPCHSGDKGLRVTARPAKAQYPRGRGAPGV